MKEINTNSRTNVRTNRATKTGSSLAVLIAMTLGCAVAAHAQAVKGSGTTNTIPVWTASTMIHDSLMSQSGSNINVSGGLVATSLSGNGSGVTNVNAATLGGLQSSAFAQLAAPNIFTSSQTINNNLTLTGSINNTLTLQGNLINSEDQGANVIGGFGGSSGFGIPPNSVASGVLGATIAGGGGFSALDNASEPNTVTANWGTVGGGSNNTAGDHATVAGGGSNTASALDATVAGGFGNFASGNSATVAGGEGNTAAGPQSFAAGCTASANNQGSFVWSGNIGGACTSVSDSAQGQFVALAPGGFTFYSSSALTSGATLASGSGSWSSLSDRTAKANFSSVDGQAILARLASLPIATWNYKTQPDSVRHMGPTAQDFSAAFGLGEDERHISTVDAQGVALAAIQALYETVTGQNQQIVELRARLAHLEQRQ